MNADMTTHATGMTIRQNLDAGTALIELDTVATRALRDFMGNAAILSGGMTIAARGWYPVTANCGHPRMTKVFSLTVIRHEREYTFCADLNRDVFAHPEGPLLGNISVKSASKWVKSALRG
jgi:hypothetical protein